MECLGGRWGGRTGEYSIRLILQTWTLFFFYFLLDSKANTRSCTVILPEPLPLR